MDLVENVYNMTYGFPKSEQYGLTSQIQRSAVSIPTNIAEGYNRNHRKEYVQFLSIAKASASELDTLLNISLRLSIISKSAHNKVQTNITEITKMLTKMISKLKFTGKGPSIISSSKPYTPTPKPQSKGVLS